MAWLTDHYFSPPLACTRFFISYNSLSSVPSSSPGCRTRAAASSSDSWLFVLPRLSLLLATSKGPTPSTNIARYASHRRTCERYVPYVYVDDQTDIAPPLAANVAVVQGLAPPRPAAEVAQEAPKPATNGGSKRITTPHACAECKRRKIRCDGRQPCGQCLGCRSPKPCYYDKHRQRVIPSRK